MDAWSTVIGQRTMESICSISRDMEKLPTLRDQFAMSAMNSLACTPWGFEAGAEHLARECYKIADAMLAARKEKK